MTIGQAYHLPLADTQGHCRTRQYGLFGSLQSITNPRERNTTGCKPDVGLEQTTMRWLEWPTQ